MAYTNPWSTAIPLGSDQAKTLDNHIRQLRLDLAERLLTLVEDLDADPLVLTAEAGGGDKTTILPASAFVGDADQVDYQDYFASYIGLKRRSQFRLFSHSLPSDIRVGKQIKLLEVMGNKNACDGISAMILSRPFAAGGASSSYIIEGSADITGPGLTVGMSDTLAITIDADTMYWVSIEPFSGVDDGSEAFVMGVRITYVDPA